MKRILVIGTSGAGKSTLAQRVSKSLGLPFIASDHFYWEPGWKVASSEKVHQQLGEVVRREAWVLDGNLTMNANSSGAARIASFGSTILG